MNVLMFGWEFPPHNSGGLGVACQGLALGLTHNGVEIEFVLPRVQDTDLSVIKFSFANIKNVKMRGINSLLYPYVTSSSYSDVFAKVRSRLYGSTLLEEVLRYAQEGGRIARQSHADINHAHDWLSFGAGIEASKANGKPLVVHVHATEFDRTGGPGNGGIDQRVYEIEREGMDKANKVIAVSGYTKNILVKHYGIKEDKVSVVHNGIDPGQYNLKVIPSGGLWEMKKLGYKIVLFVGRITLQKGVDHLLAAAQVVLQHDPKVIFVIAGSGDMERQIIGQAASMGISDKVLFAGFLRGEALSEAYSASDLFVMPSVSEPFGLTALEAALHGSPVLVSKQSGVCEVLTHALKCDFWDTQEMANKILSVVTQKSLKSTLAENGKRQAYFNSWDKAAGKVAQVYQQLIL